MVIFKIAVGHHPPVYPSTPTADYYYYCSQPSKWGGGTEGDRFPLSAVG